MTYWETVSAVIVALTIYNISQNLVKLAYFYVTLKKK